MFAICSPAYGSFPFLRLFGRSGAAWIILVLVRSNKRSDSPVPVRSPLFGGWHTRLNVLQPKAGSTQLSGGRTLGVVVQCTRRTVGGARRQRQPVEPSDERPQRHHRA